MQWHVLIDYLPQLIHGVILTLLLLAASLCSALALSLTLSYCLERQLNRLLSGFIHGYIFVFRGTPFIVQLFILYYGVGQIPWVQHSFLWVAFQSPLFCAIAALTLNSTAYTTALFYGTLQTLQSEINTAQAFGFTNLALYRYIALPRLFSIILPAYSNELVIILKSSSLCSAIAIAELTASTQSVMAQTYALLPLFVFSGALYLALNSVLVYLAKWQHQRLNIYMQKSGA